MIIKEEFLSKLRRYFGLNLYEVKIWTALLSRGVSTAGELSDIANVPRSRSYDILESLEKKGFIVMKLGKPIKYIAVPPKEVVERVKKNVKQHAESNIKQLDNLHNTEVITELNSLHTQGVELVEPTDLSGSLRGRHNLYNHIDLTIRNAEETVTIMTTSQGLMRKVEGLKPVFEQLKKRGVKIRIAAPITKETAGAVKDVSSVADVRNTTGKARFVVVDGKEIVFMVMDDTEVHPTYDIGIWVNTPFFAKALEELFNMAWKEMKPAKTILKKEKIKNKSAELTELGDALLKENLDVEEGLLDTLSIEILKNRAWRNKTFRAYDIKTNVPKIAYGKIHFEQQAIEAISKIFLEMGFEEIRGNKVQSAFWDLDALFVPQDHPAREMQDTFYIKEPASTKLPSIAKKVKAAHETGGNTGSTGWRNSWSETIAKQLLLRTHDTVLNAHALAKMTEKDLPVKIFNISKVFRNENPDWKHAFEFYQIGGIVVDKNANFRQLIHYLKTFYKKMGHDNIRIRPAHFPYTEPSVEVEVFNKEKNEWVELGGAGIFRPELVEPLLGVAVPVLAWGLGLGRIVAPYYGITDIRDFNRNDIKQLRDIKLWL